MSKFLRLFNLINEELMFEAVRLGNNIDNLPKSKQLGLLNFTIDKHAQTRDFERNIMEEIGYKQIYNIIDRICSYIITHRKYQISKLNRFSYVFELNGLYFNIIIGFENSHSAFLATLIAINRTKYEKLLNQDFYISKDNFCNFIIKSI